MNHQDYLKARIGTFPTPDFQCVGQVKWYNQEVLWFTLWTFWGSAKTWWQNNSNTFDPKYWKWVKNSPINFPKQGDTIFFDIPAHRAFINNKYIVVDYDHVAIVHLADRNNVTVIEANATGREGNVKWDEIKLTTYNYSRVIGWFTPLFLSAIGTEETVIANISKPIGTDITLPPNTHKIVTNYSQKVSGHCGFFATFNCITYNTGNKYTDRLIINVAKRFCDPDYPIQFAMKEVGKEYGYKVEIVRWEVAEKLLDNDYALGCKIFVPTEFIIDWIIDGRIDGDYNFYIGKKHSLAVRKIDWEYELMNSLGDQFKRGRHNQYRLSREQLRKAMNSDTFHLIYK